VELRRIEPQCHAFSSLETGNASGIGNAPDFLNAIQRNE